MDGTGRTQWFGPLSGSLQLFAIDDQSILDDPGKWIITCIALCLSKLGRALLGTLMRLHTLSVDLGS